MPQTVPATRDLPQSPFLHHTYKFKTSSLLLDHPAPARYDSQIKQTKFAIQLSQTLMRQPVICKMANHTTLIIQRHLTDIYQVMLIDYKHYRTKKLYDILFERSKHYFVEFL